MSDLNITLPSIRRIHSIIRENQHVELKLLTGDVVKGELKWIDDHCLGMHTSEGGDAHTMVIWRHAIAFIKTNA